MVGDNLSNLLLDIGRVDRLASYRRKNLGGPFVVSLSDEISRRLRQEKQANGKDDSPQHLERNWNAVRAGIGPVLSSVVDTGSHHEADGDAELVSRDDSATNLAGGDLGHVHDDGGGHKTDAEAGNETANNEKWYRRGSGLQDDTNVEHDTANDDYGTTTEEVGQVTGHDGTEESTGRQDRGDQGLLPGGKGEFSRAFFEVGLPQIGELLDEVLHAHNTVDITRVITEEDTTERGKGAHEIGLEGDGGLDPFDVGSARHAV